MEGTFTLLSLTAMILAILIALGLFTSLSSAIVSFLVLAVCVVSHSELMLGITIAALTISLSLMGGGAYSIDGLIYGRRRVFLPKP